MSQRPKRNRSQRINESQSTQVIENTQHTAATRELVKNCVRLFLSRMNTNVPIKRAVITQQIFGPKPGKTFDAVITKTRTELKEIYGLDLEISDAGTSNKRYFISNGLDHPEIIQTNPLDDDKMTITFLTLTHIFMSKNSASDVSLWAFLKEFELSPEDEIDQVDSIQSFVTKTLVKQQFIVCDASGGQHDDGESKRRFAWGPRAEETISKMEILKFVSQMYDNQNVKSWSTQYEDAKNQFSDVAI